MEQTVQENIESILERNKRVEADKAWEISLTRRCFIVSLTYLSACLLFWMMREEQFLVDALIPAGAYLLSTLSLPWIRQWWMKCRGF